MFRFNIFSPKFSDLINKDLLLNNIQNIILLLKDLNEDINKILTLIPNHENLKELNEFLLYYKLDEKLKMKEIKEKINKI